MEIVKLTGKKKVYYFVRELTPSKTIKILNLIKGIDVQDMDDLKDNIKRVRKVVRIAVGKRFNCTNSELVQAFITIVGTLPLAQYAGISEIAKHINKIRQS